MYEFRKASNDFKFQMEEELRNAEEADRRKKEEEERQRACAAAPPPAADPGIGCSQSTPASPYREDAVIRRLLRLRDGRPPIPHGHIQPPIRSWRARRLQRGRRRPLSRRDRRSPRRPRRCRPTGHPQAAVNTARRRRFRPRSRPGKVHGNLLPEAERSEPAAHHG